MHPPPRFILAIALLALAACSQTPAPQADAAMPRVAVAQSEERKCTNEPRTDEHDKRPRCGGMAVAPAASHAYRITLDNGESFTACDITQPFSGKIGGGMVTMSFTPADDRTGKVAWHFANAQGMADTAYDYTLSGPEEKMTGTFLANAAVCGQAAGLGACAAANKQTFTSTWTRIEDCNE
ncbi:MAG: hypothetical protein QM612_02725 [Thermomonas sp.]|uniref:hypothetical protein n=1 Tax=Thermomonas sp. TaxID=1971895 RepID=UPI0039E24037